MCGIVGKIAPAQNASELTASLQRMNDSIVHRGPNDSGIVARNGAGIGMRRLSIIDVSGGHQPISNETGDIHVVCNGEIYNFVELRASLISLGHRFTTGSDTEVLVHLYEQYGEQCFSYLRGMFGCAIFDERNRRVLVARDRMGQKPIFYAQRGSEFWLASEMKSILADEPALREPNYQTLGYFLQFAYIAEPDTAYAGVQRLPAAHYGVFCDGEFRVQPYWEFEFEPDHSVTESEWEQRLDDALSEAVKIRLHSEVPLGVFLSGGLDSSAIVAYADQAGLKPLKTFTVGFDRPEWDESADAERIATHFGCEHHLLHVHESDLSNNFAETLSSIVQHCDEPFGDASAIPTYHISKLAREHVTVILSGDGGDELFAGYSSYRGSVFAEKYRRRLPHWIGRYALPGCAQALASVLPSKLRFQALRAAKICRDSSLPIVEAYRQKTSIWSPQQLKRLLSRDAFEQSKFLGEQYLPEALWNILQSDRDLVSRLTEIDMRSYMRDDILVKVDRMSMAHSLEVRSPLLDHKLVELAAKMPSSMKLRGGQGKHIFRRVLSPKLPPQAIRKGKQGFSVPLRDWFRGSLRDLVHDQLLSSDGLPASMFSRQEVEQTLREHDRGQVDHANRIWLLLTFATWHSQNQASMAKSETSGNQNHALLARESDRCVAFEKDAV